MTTFASKNLRTTLTRTLAPRPTLLLRLQNIHSRKIHSERLAQGGYNVPREGSVDMGSDCRYCILSFGLELKY